MDAADSPIEALPATPQPRDAPVGPCATCGQLQPAPLSSASAAAASSARFVYAVGRLRAEFPNAGVEHEFAQLSGVDPRALVTSKGLKDVLSKPEAKYLARQICWVFQGPRGGDVCTVHPRDSNDVDELLDLLAGDDEEVIQALVGAPAMPALASACATRELPPVTPDQVLRFTFDEFVEAMPAPNMKEGAKDRYLKVVRDLFAQLTQRAANLGLSDEHRALNMLALRYPQIYHLAFRVVTEGKSLVGIDAHGERAGPRRVVAVRLVFRDARSHLVERYHCTIDVTDLFPYLTSSLSQTFD